MTHDARVEYEELTREARETAGAIIQAAQEAAAKIGPGSASAAGGDDGGRTRRGAAGADRLPHGVRPERAASSCAPTSRRCITDVETEWGRADPAALPAEVGSGPRRSGPGRARPTTFVANTAAENPETPDRPRPGGTTTVPCRRRRAAAGRLTPVGPRPHRGRGPMPWRVHRLCQDPSHVRPHDHDLDRPGAPARGRRPAAPDRPPLPRQARGRRRRAPAHLRRVRRRGEPGRRRARRPRPGQGRPAGAAVATTAGSTRCWPSPPRGSASCWCRSTSCSAPTRSPSSSSTRGAGGFVVEDALAPTAEKALAAAGVDRRRARLDPAVRRGAVGRLGGRRRLVDRRPGHAAATCSSPTTTRCG